MNRCRTCKFYWPAEGIGGAPLKDATYGTCRIRSVPGEFPRRDEEDWCGEQLQLAFPRDLPAEEQRPLVGDQDAEPLEDRVDDAGP